MSQLPKTPCRNQLLPDTSLLPAGACGAVPSVERQGCCIVGMQLAGIATGKMKQLELFVPQLPLASHHAQVKLPCYFGRCPGPTVRMPKPDWLGLALLHPGMPGRRIGKSTPLGILCGPKAITSTGLHREGWGHLLGHDREDMSRLNSLLLFCLKPFTFL